jgi:hypothetical protein
MAAAQISAQLRAGNNMIQSEACKKPLSAAAFQNIWQLIVLSSY